MKKHLAMALLVALAAGCAHLPQPCEYYPNAVFSGFVANWYGEHLRAMRESSLHVKPRLGIASTYRFLYLPTFSEPLLFRLEVSENGKAVLVTKRTNGKGGYGAGRLTSSSTTSVSPSQLEHFRQLIQKLSPRSMPAEVPEMRGLDGSEWILEVTEGDTYHVLSRWCARQTGDNRIGMMDDKGTHSSITMRDSIRKGSPDFDVDAYFAGTKRLTEVVDYLIDISPLKSEKDFEIY